MHLLPNFDEKDPDTFFPFSEHVAEIRRWPDSHNIFVLQCCCSAVFTGKAQRAFSALAYAESIEI